MDSTILVSIITGCFSLAGIFASVIFSQSKAKQTLEKAQAIQDVKLEELTREVREHNNFARRMPVVEEQIRVINHRLSDLERAIEK